MDRQSTATARQPSSTARATVGRVQRLAVEPARPGRREVRDPLQGDRIERRHDRVRQAGTAAGGQHPGDVRPRIALQLDVEERRAARPPSRTSARVGMPSASSASTVERIDPVRPAMQPLERLVVVDHERPVGRPADVQLETVAGRDRRARPRTPPACSRARRASRRDARGAAVAMSPPATTRSRARSRCPRWSLGYRVGSSGAGRSKHEPGRLDPDRAADPDVVEAFRVAVGVHRRRLEPGRPGHARARRRWPRRRRTGTRPSRRRAGPGSAGIGVEVAHQDRRVGRRAPPSSHGRIAAICSSRCASSGAEVVEVGDDDEDGRAAGQRDDRPLRRPVQAQVEPVRLGRARAARGRAGCCRTPGRPAQPRTDAVAALPRRADQPVLLHRT